VKVVFYFKAKSTNAYALQFKPGQVGKRDYVRSYTVYTAYLSIGMFIHPTKFGKCERGSM
jgi:hypothetical protein